MSGRSLKRYAVSILAAVLPLILLSFLWFSHNNRKEVRASLQTAANILRASGDAENFRDFAYTANDIRVTVTDETGRVLADNRADPKMMDNHADRPEFIQARRGGYGEAVRRSATTGKNTVYIMTRMNDGTYIRLARATELSHIFLVWLFVPQFFLCACLAVFIFVLARNRRIERMRQEFVANVSHELKTPLTSIKGFAELTSLGLVNGVDSVKDFQKKIVAQSDRLLATINDILLLSRLESAVPKELVIVNTRAVAEQVKEALKHIADEKSIIIQVSGEGTVLAESEPIYHMIYNLVDNGIKYGKSGGYVKIILSGKKIAVSDNGIGIPEEDAERVFERFYRVDKSRSAKTGGTGLGLAIVKHTAQKYGGSVSIKSANGNGTTVTAEL